jgi:hypothetical protein
MYMTGSKRKSLTSSETSTIVALSPTNSETSTEIAFTPPPTKKTRCVIYRTPSPIKRNRTSSTPETPTVVLESPMADDLPDYSAPFGTPEQSDEREHEYTPVKAKRPKPTGGKITRKRRRRRRTYKRVRKTV